MPRPWIRPPTAAAALVALIAGCQRVPSGPDSAAQSTQAASALPRVSSGAPLALAPVPPSSAPAAAMRPLPPPLGPGGARATSSTRGLVVAGEAQAAAVGAAVLERGGNAADAAIATVLALTVTHSSAASLGGGGFALIRPRGGPTVALDFRETAPRALTRAGFDRMIAAGARGPAAVGVPGTAAGLELLHRRFATRPFADLVAPVVALARDGNVLSAWQGRTLGWSYARLDAGLRRTFGRGGTPRAAGQRVSQPELAATLERLAAAGASEIYTGETAQRLARALAPEGPSLEDLGAYQALEREPLRFAYRGYTLETMPPPSAGGVALSGILLALDAAAGSENAAEDATLHRFLEASRRAQTERRFAVVDPARLAATEGRARQARWLDAAFWLRVPIDPERATPSAALHAPAPPATEESEHTTHVSVADAHGMVVSLTTTLSASYGAKIAASGTGIVLNNAVASFSASGDNQPEPGRRTTSSMAPTLILRGDEANAVLGTPGGDTIPSTLAQVIRALVVDRRPLDQAVDARRWHQGYTPDVARYEPDPPLDAALLDALRRRGHRLQAFRRPIGGANCILVEPGATSGYADPREQGSVGVPAAAR